MSVLKLAVLALLLIFVGLAFVYSLFKLIWRAFGRFLTVAFLGLLLIALLFIAARVIST
jgi:hypothetical protein